MTEIETLKAEVRNLEDRRKPLIEQAGKIQEQIDETWEKIATLCDGVKLGDRVLYRKKTFVVTGRHSPEYARPGEKGWLLGRRVKKDGSLQEKSQHLFHEWIRISDSVS